MPVTLAVTPAAPPVPALKYRLLPDLTDLTSANAASLYYRAILIAGKELSAEAMQKARDWRKLPSGQLPRDEVRSFLGPYRKALSEVAQAARRNQCDWQLPLR